MKHFTKFLKFKILQLYFFNHNENIKKIEEGHVAQSVERKTDNLDGIGSSPVMPTMTEYIGVLLYIALSTALGMIILFAAYKVRPRRLDLEKATAYECGFEPFGEARSPFDVGFY